MQGLWSQWGAGRKVRRVCVQEAGRPRGAHPAWVPWSLGLLLRVHLCVHLRVYLHVWGVCVSVSRPVHSVSVVRDCVSMGVPVRCMCTHV